MADIIRPSFQKAITYQPDAGTARLTAIEAELTRLAETLERIERQNADLLLLGVSQKTIMLAMKTEFPDSVKATLRAVLKAPPFNGICPCCRVVSIVSPRGELLSSAEFDHFYHATLNLPEHGWPICRPCHQDVHVSHLRRMQALDRFHAYQDAVSTYKAAARSDA